MVKTFSKILFKFAEKTASRIKFPSVKTMYSICSTVHTVILKIFLCYSSSFGKIVIYCYLNYFDSVECGPIDKLCLIN